MYGDRERQASTKHRAEHEMHWFDQLPLEWRRLANEYGDDALALYHRGYRIEEATHTLKIAERKQLEWLISLTNE